MGLPNGWPNCLPGGCTFLGDPATKSSNSATEIWPGGPMRHRRHFRAWVMAGLLGGLAPRALNATARAEDGVPAEASAEYLYTADDARLDRRVQAVNDTQDVLLAMEWLPTVDGIVDGARICLDLDQAEVNA